MRLKSCSLRGFKSFADPVNLEFGNGMSAIVGPNGSGKSNVLDAIKWVLGEQSARSLRGNRMNDVIFAGTNNRAPLGMAEVKLTVDNSDRILSVESDEVTITRRLFRSGESEYRLNGKSCRLKDIADVFLNTGIGRQAYAFIGQGQIDEILNSKPEDLRLMFEEAAGISRYKARKQESVAQLGRTEDNIAKVEHVIAELQNGLDELQEKARVANEFNHLDKERRVLVKEIILSELNQCLKKVEKAQARKDDLGQKKHEIETVIQKYKSEEHELGFSIQRIEDSLQSVKQKSVECENEIEKREQRLEMLLDRIAEQESRKKQLQEDLTICEEELINASQAYDNKLSSVSNFQAEYQKVAEGLARQHETLAQLEESLRVEDTTGLANNISELELELRLAEQERNDKKAECIRLEEIVHEDREKLRELQQNRDCAEAKEDLYKKQIIEFKDQLAELEGKKQRLDEFINSQVSKVKDMQTEIERVDQQRNSLKIEHSSLSRAVSSYAGYYSGVKNVLVARKNHNALCDGVIGVVAELIDVPEHLKQAVTAVLKGALQYVVTTTAQDAARVIDFLNSTRGGRATFLPLDRARDRIHSLPELLKKHRGVIGRANDLVSCSSGQEAIVSHLLGNVVIVQDKETALEITERLNTSLQFVTLNGEVFSSSGTITGGRTKGPASDLLGRTQQLETTARLLQKIEEEITHLKSNYKNTTQQLDERKKRLQQTTEAIHETHLKLAETTKDKAVVEHRLEGVCNQIARKESQITTDTAKANQLKSEIEQLCSRTINLHSERDELTQRLNLLLADQEEVRSLRDSLNEMRVVEVRLQESLKYARTQVTELQHSLTKLEQQKEGLHEQLQEVDALLFNHHEEEQKLKNDVTVLRQERVDFGQEVVKLQQSYQSVHASIEQLWEKQQLAEREKVRLESDVQSAAMSIVRFEMELKQKEAEAYHEIGIVDLDRLDEWQFSRSIYNKKIQQKVELEQQTESLGDIDQGALREYTRRTERIEFLLNQKNDLGAAKGKLQQVIDEIDAICSTKLKVTIEQINSVFGAVFAQLFQGGQARLHLTDAESVLESGVEIEARPPGKKKQRLSLLSGGEKALTAIALIFAIFKVKPAPFCVLDEIDAALDEANNVRLADYLRHMADIVQFIVITHSKQTMVSANTLYGITMEEKGISKVVTLQLSDKAS